jgi:hypothetical protein
MSLDSTEFKTPLIGIIQMSSELTKAVLSRCITKKINDSKKQTVLILLF